RTSDIFSLVHASSERTAFNRRFHKPGHPILTVQTSSENDMPRWGVLYRTLSLSNLPDASCELVKSSVSKGTHTSNPLSPIWPSTAAMLFCITGSSFQLESFST